MPRGKAISDEIRAAAINMSQQKELNNQEIHECLNVPLRSVQRIVSDAKNGRPVGKRPRKKRTPLVLNDDSIRVKKKLFFFGNSLAHRGSQLLCSIS